jgi:hypothetical protein
MAKKCWGHAQEDICPVCQFEKLWGDMTTLPEANCGFVVVSRLCGQQLKDQAQVDGCCATARRRTWKNMAIGTEPGRWAVGLPYHGHSSKHSV